MWNQLLSYENNKIREAALSGDKDVLAEGQGRRWLGNEKVMGDMHQTREQQSQAVTRGWTGDKCHQIPSFCFTASDCCQLDNLTLRQIPASLCSHVTRRCHENQNESGKVWITDWRGGGWGRERKGKGEIERQLDWQRQLGWERKNQRKEIRERERLKKTTKTGRERWTEGIRDRRD